VIGAKTVIVTTSTGVLSAGLIDFEPALPETKMDAFARISMGTYNNIALMFSEDVFGAPPDTRLTYETSSKESASFLLNLSSTNLTFGLVGGNFGRKLEQSGVSVAVDFALGELKKIFGNDIEKKFVKGTATRWREDPWTLGAYASAEPGAFHFRSILREPVANRIFFAGEACHQKAWATCAGAHLSGIDVAKEVIRVL